MTGKRFEEDRYIIKQSQIWDTYKNLPITPKLTKHECDVIIAHLNFHKDCITTRNNQLKYVHNKYYKLEKENEQLKQALKESYINEICENCKYGHYWISETFGFGKEGEFECTKKHFGNEHWKCDGLTECDDFELEIKGDV